MTVLECLAALGRDPCGLVFRRWNWKSAAMSGALRGAIFFFTNLPSGVHAASTALAVDVVVRVPFVGVSAALTQAFASARPAWVATLTVIALVPAAAHAVEFTVHSIAKTPELRTSIVVSVMASALSSAFNLFVMRRGVLTVGAGADPLRADLRRLPRLAAHFLLALPLAAGRAVREACCR